MSEQNPSRQSTTAATISGRDIDQNVVGVDSRVTVVRQSYEASSVLAERLEVDFPKRKSTYFSVTEAEINNYAQLGWLSTVSLTLFGAFLGLVLGCVVALLQDSLPATAISTLNALAWFSGIVAVIFLAVAILLLVSQVRSKKAWESAE